MQSELNRLVVASKYVLSFLWIFTGITSMFIAPETGYEILAGAQITGLLAELAVYGGGLLDIALGIWILTSYRIDVCCLAQIVVIIIYSLLLTLIAPVFWLHPFGPLTKNFPIIMLIVFIFLQSKKTQ